MIKKENFNEEEYLTGNPDVVDLLKKRVFPSGYDHYLNVGYSEGRWCPRLQKIHDDIMVSVVMPNYNKEKYLEHAIESVLNQDYTNLELIIVDDVSTDTCVSIIKSYQKMDGRLKLIQHMGNSGGCAAPRNTGLLSAMGEVVCFLDSDDILYNGCLKTRVAKYRKFSKNNDNVIGVFSGTQTLSEDYDLFPYAKKKNGKDVIDFIASAGDCPFNSNQPMLKRAELTKFGGFDESLTQAEDWHLWLRIMRHGYCFINTGFDGVGYRNCPESMVRENSLQHVANSCEILESAHRELMDEEIISGTPFVYRKPWIAYKKQIMISNRVFSFLSMTKTDGNYGDIVDRYIPDLDGIGAFVKPMEATISGLKRKTANATDSNASVLRIILKDVISKLSSSFRPSKDVDVVREAEIGKKSLLRIGVLKKIDVLLFPHSAYHVLELSYVAEKLNALGITTAFVNSEIPYRKQGVEAKLMELGIEYINHGNLLLYGILPKAAVCLCDWDIVIKRIFINYKERGVKTFGIVEGVQDYRDADTGRPRNAYGTVEHLFIPGSFDKRYFDNEKNKYISGISRIDTLLKDESTIEKDIDVLVNVNFTYGVLENQRENWISSVVEAIGKNKLSYGITQHCADKADLGHYKVLDGQLYDLLRKSRVIVTRFSTVVLEALALKVPVVYYNPNIEKVDKFCDPLGAFEYADTIEELDDCLRNVLSRGWGHYSKAANEYLKLHCNIGKEMETCEFIANKIGDLINDI
jgi:glycosyltransferase involved in cell wall biosynthesis